MKARLSFVFVVCVVGAGLISSTAAADRPVKEELSPVGDQFDCGGTLLTVTGGTLVNISHVQEVSRTPRGDFILVLRGGATVTSSEGFRDKVRAHLEQMKLGAK